MRRADTRSFFLIKINLLWSYIYKTCDLKLEHKSKCNFNLKSQILQLGIAADSTNKAMKNLSSTKLFLIVVYSTYFYLYVPNTLNPSSKTAVNNIYEQN